MLIVGQISNRLRKQPETQLFIWSSDLCAVHKERKQLQPLQHRLGQTNRDLGSGNSGLVALKSFSFRMCWSKMLPH